MAIRIVQIRLFRAGKNSIAPDFEINSVAQAAQG